MRERIIALPTNFCVTAGAGAGKTTCLVATYVGLLAGGEGRAPLGPEEIVAITFTDKAAQEMRQRVVKEVARRALEGQPGPDWEGLLPRVEWAPISTIHSFCASLLREFATRLDLDPEFAVLEAREFSELRGEVIDEVLRQRLQEQDQRLARLLAQRGLHGRHSLAQTLSQVQAELATQGITAAQAALSTAQAHAQALATAPGLLAELGHIFNEMAAGLASGEFNAKAGYGQKIRDICELWPIANKALEEKPQDLETLDSLGRILGGNWGKAKELKDAAQAAQQALLALAALPAAAAWAEDLLSLHQEIESALEDELKRRAALSFDHLLLRALELLRDHPLVLEELRGRYGALLVDEFQDVNPVQGRLVNLLSGLERPPDQAQAARPPVTLLVGDRKQSIYAFRGADVSVFSQAMHSFRQGAGQVAPLSENFRSRPELIEFFNRLFPKLFAQREHAEHAIGSYVEFSGDDQQVVGRPGMASSQPAVEVLDCRALGGEQTSLAAWRQLEASALAQHLRGLVTAGHAPGDMVILLRRLTQVEAYQRALAAAGLDYYTVGGRGFYQRQEIGDLYQALLALLDPRDALALAGLLRSPLVGLSDESLLALALDEDGQARSLTQALAQGLDLPAWAGEVQRQRWARARSWLRGLAPLARRLAPAELLECLVEASDLLPVWLGTPDGEQRVANLRKLIELARDPALAGGGMEAFARRLAQLMEASTDDPQAPLMGEEASVIRLMSIHQAKGLEFPLVALADLAFKANQGAPLLGPGGVLAPKAPDAAGGPSRPTPLSEQLLRRQRAVEEAEAARLFYVALTRAKERLVLCLNGAPAQFQGYWGNWLAQHVLDDPAVSRLEPEVAGTAVVAPALAASPRMAPAEADLPAQAQRVIANCLARPPLPPALVSESVSGLEDWLECPRRYLFTRGLGLDSAWLASAPGQGRAGGADATALGSAVHRLLELTDLAQGPQGLDETLARLNLPPELAGQARQLAAGWWACDLPQMLADAGPGSLAREQGFSLLLPAQGGGPAVELIGEFDLLVQPQAGPALLVDYKVSGKIEPEKYRAQMALYCLALWQGQGRQGPPPRAWLCYLQAGGAHLRELVFSAQNLEQWRARVLEAGRGIANLPPGAEPSDLTPGEHCTTGQCVLARAGLCSSSGSAG